MRANRFFQIGFLLAAGLCLAAPALAAEPTGVWSTAEGKSHVRVSRCGTNLCGNVIWLKVPNDEAGKPTDLHFHMGGDVMKATRAK